MKAGGKLGLHGPRVGGGRPMCRLRCDRAWRTTAPPPRFEPHKPTPVAIVQCPFGPSLEESHQSLTWQARRKK